MSDGKRKLSNPEPIVNPRKPKALKTQGTTDVDTMSTTLCTEVRPLIDLIDRLRAFDLDGDLSLPAVAVIGDQSAGKSSVLEAISGVQLPRGTGIVTRCPLEMRLKHAKKAGVWKGKISYKDADKKVQERTIESPDTVGDMVSQAQNDMTTSDKGISHDLITLDVTSSDVPDLTLIDLPGIARNAVKGQPADIETQIKSLICRYIEQRETIILAVLQSNIDIATCEAIKLAREFDEGGRRTIGVLTKPDLVDKGSESEVMKILNNDEHHLSKGYIMVKCRGQAAVKEGQSLKEALQEENTFFRDHSHFGTLRPAQWGISTLSKRLSRELRCHIKAVLPDLKMDVQRKLMATKTQLNSLGEDPPKSASEKRTKALMMVTRFNTVSDTCIVNGQHVNDKNVPAEVRRIYCDVRHCFEKLSKKATQCAPNIHDLDVRKDIENRMKMARGKEFLNCIGRFDLVESYVKDSIQKMEQPALTCFKEVSDITGAALKELAVDSFNIFPGLNERAKDVIAKVKVQIQKNGKEDIEKYFKMEDIIYAQDSTYKNELCINHSINLPDPVDTVLSSVASYYKVASKRLCDVVPLITQYHVFRKQHESLQQELLNMASDESTLVHIEEDEDVAEERRQCKRRQERLTLAEQELDKVN